MVHLTLTICAPIEMRTYFSLIVEKVELEDMPPLFLKIKLDKRTHIEVQYYGTDYYEKKK